MREQDGAKGRRTQDENANQTQLFWFMEEQERAESYRIGCHVVEQGSQSPVGNQAGEEKLAIGTSIDLNDNDQGMKNETTKQIYGAGITPK